MAEMLRNQQSVTIHIIVFLRINLFNPDESQYHWTAELTLPFATHNTRVIISTANLLLKDLFRPGYRYQKCGVKLSQIQPLAF
jgi:DNA polymerase V